MGDRTDVVLAPTQSTFDGPLRSLAPIAEGFAKLAMICVMLKRLAEPKLTCAM
jgi:hypothetical protein